MPVSICAAAPADAEEMTAMGVHAFRHDALQTSIFAHDAGSAAQQAEHLQWRTSRLLQRMDGPGRHFFKAVDDVSGRIVGWAGVFAPDAETSTAAAAVVAPVPPAFLSQEMLDLVMGRMKEAKAELVGERSDVWYVPTLAVHPEHQGQGVAKRLLDAIFGLVDPGHGAVYLESTPIARNMYQRSGFRPMGEIVLLPGEYSLYPMLRDIQ